MALSRSRTLLAGFKPAMIAEYGKKGEDAESFRWRMFRIFTNVVTVGA